MTDVDIPKEKISIALQKIQDNVVPGAKGLDRTEVRKHIVFWELGVLLKEFVDLKSIPTDTIHDELDKNFRRIEKKIRSDGKRKGKNSLPSWMYKNQSVKPPRIQEPDITWVLICWDFVKAYQDLERWNLVANLSGAMFKEGFVRKRAEDLIPYFTKEDATKNTKQKQDKFIKEMSKFKKNPSRKQFGSDSSSKGLIPKIFGKAKININLARKNFFSIQSEVQRIIDEETGTPEFRKEFAHSIGINQIVPLRRLLRLISITDKQKFEKRLNQLVGKLPRTIKTKHLVAKELFGILYSLIKDFDYRKKFLNNVTRHDLVMLNTKLSAVTSPEGFREYQENQKSREALFN